MTQTTNLSFYFLNFGQCITTMIDNLFKLLVVFLLIQKEGVEKSAQILAFTNIIFVLPFILFSSISGMLADRFCKRDIIITTKIFEFFILLIALFAFSIENSTLLCILLFLLATHTAFAIPAKYGILPEILDKTKIVKGNARLISATSISIITGSFLASYLLDISNKNFIITTVFCSVLSLIGLISSFFIEKNSGYHILENQKIFCLKLKIV